MNARRLIDALASGQEVSFEHVIDLGEKLQATIYVSVLEDNVSYQLLGVTDAAGEVDLDPNLEQAVETAFENGLEQLIEISRNL